MSACLLSYWIGCLGTGMIGGLLGWFLYKSYSREAEYKSKYQTILSQKKEIEKEHTALRSEVDTLKVATNVHQSTSLKEDYDALRLEFDNYKSTTVAQESAESTKEYVLLQSEFDALKAQYALVSNTPPSERIVEVEKIVEIEKIVEVEKPIEVVKELVLTAREEVAVETVKLAEVAKQVEVPYEVEVVKEVETIQYVEKPIEVIKEIELREIVEVPVEVERVVSTNKSEVVESIVSEDVEELIGTSDEIAVDLEQGMDEVGILAKEEWAVKKYAFVEENSNLIDLDSFEYDFTEKHDSLSAYYWFSDDNQYYFLIAKENKALFYSEGFENKAECRRAIDYFIGNKSDKAQFIQQTNNGRYRYGLKDPLGGFIGNSIVYTGVEELDNWFSFMSGPSPVNTSGKDNLKKIEGIGPKIESLLNDAGVQTFKKLADTSHGILRAILNEGGSRFKMHDPSTWSEQAQLANDGKWEALKAMQDELKGGKKA